jgi:cell division protein FtsL
VIGPIDERGRRWRNGSIVRQRDRRGTQGLWLWALGLAVAVLPAAVYLVEQGWCTRLAYHSDELRAELETLEERERRLRVERARLERLSEIESWAHEQGLVRPEPQHVVIVSLVDAPGDR